MADAHRRRKAARQSRARLSTRCERFFSFAAREMIVTRIKVIGKFRANTGKIERSDE